MDYPNKYYSFKGGFEISDEVINEWIEDGLRYLKENKEAEYYYVSSGDTIVFINYSDDNEVVIRVCKNYEEKYYNLEEV